MSARPADRNDSDACTSSIADFLKSLRDHIQLNWLKLVGYFF